MGPSYPHAGTLDASRVQPQGDPWGPLLMSLCVQAGVQAVLRTCNIPENDISIKTYLDDRSCTARNAAKLHEIYLAWSQWSTIVLACVRTWPNVRFQQLANAKLKMLVRSLILLESPAIRVLGAVSCSVRRAYRAAEVCRFEAARKCARLLGCCDFFLPLQLRYLRQFSLSRLISGGWLALRLFQAAFGLLCVGVGTAVLGFAVSFLVGTFLILFGLLASSLQSFGTIFPRVLVLSGRVILALPPMLCVLG